MIMWSGIEACSSTIYGNLPCYAPLLRRANALGHFLASLRSMFSPLLSRWNAHRKSFQKTTSMETIADGPYRPSVPSMQTVVEGGTSKPSKQHADVQLPYIKVDTSMRVTNAV